MFPFIRRFFFALRGLLLCAAPLAVSTSMHAQVAYGGTYQVSFVPNDIRSMSTDLNGVLWVLDENGNLYKVTPDSTGLYSTLTFFDSKTNYFEVSTNGSAPYAIQYNASGPSAIFSYSGGTTPATGLVSENTGIFPFAVNGSAVSFSIPSTGAWLAGSVLDASSAGTWQPVYPDASYTQAMAMDPAHNIYALDASSTLVYNLLKLPATGSTTWASATVPLTTYPIGVSDSIALDSFDNLYVPNPASGVILAIPATNSSTGNEFTAVSVNTPYAVASDRFGNLFYGQHAGSDGNIEHVVRYPLIDFGSTNIATPVTKLLYLTVTASSANEAVTDIQNLVQTPPTFEYAIIYGGASCQSASSTTWTCSVPVQFSALGSGMRFGSIQIVNSSNKVVSTVYLSGTGNGPNGVFGFGSQVIGKAGTSLNGVTLQSATAVGADPYGNLYVLDKSAAKIIKYTLNSSNGTYSGSALSLTGVSLTSNGLNYIAVDGAGYVYTDQGNSVVKIANGVATTVSMANLTLGSVNALYVDSYGTLHILDNQNLRIIMVPALGQAEIEGTLPSGTHTGIITHPGLGLGLDLGFLSGIHNYYAGVTGMNDTYTVDPSVKAFDLVRFPIPGLDLSPAANTVPYAPSQMVLGTAGDAVFADSVSGTYSYETLFGVSGSPSKGTLPITPPAGCAPSTLVQTMNGDFAATSSACGEVIVYPAQYSPLPLAFHNTPAGTTSNDSPKSVTLYNMGNQALSITPPAALPTGFTLDGSTTCPGMSGGSVGTLNPDANCTIAISFSPPDSGNYTGAVQITDNNFGVSGTQQSFAVSGTTVPTLASFQIALTPGGVIKGIPETLTITAYDGTNSVLTTFSGPVTLTSTDSAAQFSSITWNNGVGTATVTFQTIGSQYVTATSGAISASAGPITVAAFSTFTVTTTQDFGAGSLRQAVNNATTAGGGTINFSSLFSTPQTIALTGGPITVSPYTTIQGYQAGSGNSRTNTVTVIGLAGPAFSIAAGAQNVAIQDLTVAGGGNILNSGNLTVSDVTFNSDVEAGGGGIDNHAGSLTVLNSTFANNRANSGGAIWNESGATAIVINSTFANNAASLYGGGILNQGTLTVLGSTFSTNYAKVTGGAIYNLGTAMTFGNTLLSGNRLGTAASPGNYDDIEDTVVTTTTLAGGNIIGYYNSNSATAPAINLSPLANYGGTQQTMLPLPASPAICAGVAASTGNNITTDERGYSRATAYGSTNCIDTGAAQTNYSIAFGQGPSTTVVGSAISPAPTVQLYENGSAFAAANQSVSVALTNAPAIQAGTGSAATDATGLATFGNVTSTAADSNETLTATLPLNTVSRSTVSDTFSFYSLSQSIFFPAIDTSVVYSHVSPVTLGATASSGLAVSYGASGPGSLAGNVLTYTGPGTVTVTATQSGNGTYVAASPASQSITVAADASVATLATGTTGPPETLTFTATTTFTIGAIAATTDGNLGNAYAIASGGSCHVGLGLTAGQTCTVKVTFTPTAPKILTGQVIVSDNSATPQPVGNMKLISVRYR